MASMAACNESVVVVRVPMKQEHSLPKAEGREYVDGSDSGSGSAECEDMGWCLWRRAWELWAREGPIPGHRQCNCYHHRGCLGRDRHCARMGLEGCDCDCDSDLQPYLNAAECSRHR